MDKELYRKALHAAKCAVSNYHVVYLVLHGSQNYNLDFYTEDYTSDFDWKAIVLPSLDDVLRGAAKVSTKIDYEYGQIDIKDIRAWEEVLQKGNPAYLEGLFSDYYWVDPDYKDCFETMREHREEYVAMLWLPMLNASVGMMHEKYKAMTHPYPTIKWKIDKWGYDGKQSSHLIRIYSMLQMYFCGGYDYEEVLDANLYPAAQMRFIYEHKLNATPLGKAQEQADWYLNEAIKLKEKVIELDGDKKINYDLKYYYHDLVIGAIRQSVIDELGKE